MMITPPPARKPTPYNGVRQVMNSHGRRRWQCLVVIGGNKRHVGTYDTPEEAAQAYDDYSRAYGVTEHLNFPERRREG